MRKNTLSILLLMALLATGAVSAQSRGFKELDSIKSLSKEELTNIYWDCELMQNQGLIAPSVAMVCSGVYESLLKNHFKGDFQEFMKWWGDNKNLALTEAKKRSEMKSH